MILLVVHGIVNTCMYLFCTVSE